jgi:hypothetical protein
MPKVLTRRVSSSTFEGLIIPLRLYRICRPDLTFIRDFLKQAEADSKKDAAGKEKAAH